MSYKSLWFQVSSKPFAHLPFSRGFQPTILGIPEGALARFGKVDFDGDARLGLLAVAPFQLSNVVPSVTAACPDISVGIPK